MKTKRSAIVTLFASVLLFVTHEALAFYNPETGRWLNRDRMGEAGGRNVHGFSLNDPVNRLDFLGLRGLKPSCISRLLKKSHGNLNTVD